MDQQSENELLMHVAADTDLLTAFAALPRESDMQGRPQPSTPKTSVYRIICAVVIFVAMIALWWLMQ
jgi:hypothetical protein